jgi:hypothetical protein
MSPIKDTISNLFSKNKKKDEGVSSEIENQPEIKEETEHEVDIQDESKPVGDWEHETEFENETSTQEEIDTDPEWEKRVLCSDGNCIGIIGPDGRCKECGKPYHETEQIYDHDANEQEISDTPPDEVLKSDEQEFFPENSEEINETSDESSTETESESESESESDWDKRVLCSDGNCIGVIGPDGRCKECGKPYEG